MVILARRKLLALAAAAAIAPRLVQGQAPGRTYRIAWLVVRPLWPGEGVPFLPYFNPFRERLAERGFVEGNVARRLGVTLPQSILLRADRVID